jgi:hypothetical protein
MYNSEIPSRAELPTTRQLLRSTLIAAAAAAAILVTAILPAEYGIDPTGIGRLTGLTEMGEIKTQLSAEAAADRAGSMQEDVTGGPGAPAQCSSLFESIVANLFIRSAAAQDSVHSYRAANGDLPGAKLAASSAGTPTRTDEMSVTLKPGQGAEIKLKMKKGAKVNYSWTAVGGAVNFDTHGDGAGKQSKSYEKGRAVKEDSGVLEAAFDGNHGWFWRNRTKGTVTVNLRTEGAYAEIKRVL